MLTARFRAPYWSAWLAAWVIMLGALAPTVTHWLAHWQTQWQASNALPGAAICSTSASASFKQAGSQTSDLPASQAHDHHCGFCLPHDGGSGLPPIVALMLPLGEQLSTVPALFLHAPRTLYAWSQAQPRAPPQA